MKRFATLTLLWTAIAMAQPATVHIGASYGAIAIPGFLPPTLDPTDPAGYWASSLGLDAGQQAALKTILADQETATRALRPNLEQARGAVLASAKENNADSEIDQKSAGLGSVFAQAVAAQAKAYARFYALLSVDQRQKLDKLSAMPAGAGFTVVAGPSVDGVVKQ